jgi:hypothetical protein
MKAVDFDFFAVSAAAENEEADERTAPGRMAPSIASAAALTAAML